MERFSHDSCKGCIWADMCDSNTPCDDYTRGDNLEDRIYYACILEENMTEYELMVADYDDGNCGWR